MRESIFFSSIRAFFLMLFGLLGLLVGLVLIAIAVGGMSETIEGEPEIKYTYTPEILANSSGIRKKLSKDSPVILKLNINGIIGVDKLTHQAIEQQLIESREQVLENRVKAILLYIDSPGGTVVDADAIYRSIKRYKETYKVPVYAYVDGLCASGGMYIACAADKIYASNASIIGSVGVIIPSILNFYQLLEKIGVQSITLYEGKGKDDLNPMRPWRKGEEDNIKDAIAYYYGSFVDIVAANRPLLDKTKLINDYGANVYPAALAQEYGYIDEANANLDLTLKMLAEKIEVKDDDYQFIVLESKSWLSEIFGGVNGINGSFDLLKGKITHQVILTPDTHPQLMNQYLYLYKP